MNRQEFSKWLQTNILLNNPDPDECIAEWASNLVSEARRFAQSLGWPDLIRPCGRLTSQDDARDLLSRALAVVDPPATGPLTVKQAAERLGVSPKTVYDLIEKGRLRCIRIGRAIRIWPSDLEMGTQEARYKHLRL
jgi:excisionase family DNA binding protein